MPHFFRFPEQTIGLFFESDAIDIHTHSFLRKVPQNAGIPFSSDTKRFTKPLGAKIYSFVETEKGSTFSSYPRKGKSLERDRCFGQKNPNPAIHSRNGFATGFVGAMVDSTFILDHCFMKPSPHLTISHKFRDSSQNLDLHFVNEKPAHFYTSFLPKKPIFADSLALKYLLPFLLKNGRNRCTRKFANGYLQITVRFHHTNASPAPSAPSLAPVGSLAQPKLSNGSTTTGFMQSDSKWNGRRKRWLKMLRAGAGLS
jgi:hypothetical protein